MRTTATISLIRFLIALHNLSQLNPSEIELRKCRKYARFRLRDGVPNRVINRSRRAASFCCAAASSALLRSKYCPNPSIPLKGSGFGGGGGNRLSPRSRDAGALEPFGQNKMASTKMTTIAIPHPTSVAPFVSRDVVVPTFLRPRYQHVGKFSPKP
jgi:hypothetical protein